jgi:hypothetical protein
LHCATERPFCEISCIGPPSYVCYFQAAVLLYALKMSYFNCAIIRVAIFYETRCIGPNHLRMLFSSSCLALRSYNAHFANQLLSALRSYSTMPIFQDLLYLELCNY